MSALALHTGLVQRHAETEEGFQGSKGPGVPRQAGEHGTVRLCIRARGISQLPAGCGCPSKICSLLLFQGVVKDPFIRNWLDLLSFMLSGLPCNGTIAAEIAFMFNEW